MADIIYAGGATPSDAGSSGGGSSDLTNGLLTGVFPMGTVLKIPSGCKLKDNCFCLSSGITEIDFNGNDIPNSYVCQQSQDLVKVSNFTGNKAYSGFNNCPKLEEINAPLFLMNTYRADRLGGGSQNLKKVIISPETLIYTNSCFSNCYKLDISTLPFSKITLIDGWAFSIMQGQEDDTIKSYELNLPVIEELKIKCFQNRIKLIKITIGNKIRTIDSSAFTGCTNLKTITINKPKDSIAGAPWGATNATVVWNG